MHASHAAGRRALFGIFVVSGFTGLIYESIWSHYLKLFLGHAAYAQTLVLAIFMGGMALGSWLVARYSGRIRRLLLGYVVVEGVTGFLGIVFHRTFVAVTDLSFEAVIPALSSNALIHGYKWLLAALLILPQSTLLGMTFPLISGGIIRRWPERPGETLSMLYFTNCLGAALGVLVSGFVLIEAVGLPGTILTAGLLNVALALAVWFVIRRQEEPRPEVQPAPSTEPRGALRAAHRWFLIAAFATGAASFIYEIGWIRMLSLVLGSSTHSFELMLSSFILGLAFGGLWIRRRIDAIGDPLRYLGVTMMVMGTLALLTLPAYNKTFDVMAWAMRTFTSTENGYTAFNVVGQAISALIMIPTTFCAGMTLPLLTHALRMRDGERAIGAVYAANTLGAIVGVLAAIHLALPMIGLKGTIMAGVAIHMALGVSGLALTPAGGRPLRFAAAGVCAILLAAVGLGVVLDPQRMTAGVYRTGFAVRPVEAEVLYLRDGKTATISLVRLPDGTVSIATNGKPDAAIQMKDGQPPAADEITMVLAAALPLSMHPAPRRVANIGFGSGLTSSALLASDQIERLDSIEIEPFMVEAAKLGYYPRVRRVFEDPRSHIIYEDAKTFFATARERYDVIVSEPSNPWVSGVASLFSDEFYRRIVDYLHEDGYLVQWLQTYETDMSIVASVIKALSPHFGAYAIYNTDDTNIMIVATPGSSLHLPTDRVFAYEPLRRELERVGIRTAADFERRRIGDKKTLDPFFFSYESPKNSDYFPFVDLNAPRLRFMRANALELTRMQLLPVPVVELLAEREASALADRPPEESTLALDTMIWRSASLRDAIVTGRIDKVDLEMAGRLMLLDVKADICEDPGARVAWSQAVHAIGEMTAAFLSPSELHDVWSRIEGSACYSRMSEADKAWVALLSAVAERDIDRMARTALAALDSGAWKPFEARRAYATAAAAVALLKLNRPDEAEEVLRREPGIAGQPDDYRLPLRALLALSIATRTNGGQLASTAAPRTAVH